MWNDINYVSLVRRHFALGSRQISSNMLRHTRLFGVPGGRKLSRKMTIRLHGMLYCISKFESICTTVHSQHTYIMASLRELRFQLWALEVRYYTPHSASRRTRKVSYVRRKISFLTERRLKFAGLCEKRIFALCDIGGGTGAMWSAAMCSR